MRAADGEEERINVLLSDGRTLRRQCLAKFLELSGIGVRIIALEDGGQSEADAPTEGAADLALIDTGDKACSHPEVKKIFDDLRTLVPGVPIVVISDREEVSAVVDAMQLGARAYFPSSLDPKILIETLRFVQNGGTFVPLSALMSRHGPHSLPPATRIETLGITGRELRVLELLQRGQSNKVIARELDIEEGTVKVHVHRILKKLHANNRTQAALLARQIAEEVVKPDFPR